MESRVSAARDMFLSGYNCAQSVFVTYSDLFGMDRETALRLSCSMGGGVGRLREVCGTVSGMALMAGLVCGNTDPDDQEAKTKNYETVRNMAERFKKEHQTIICRELLGLIEAEESAAPSLRTEEYYKSRPCVRFVETAARIIEETFPELFGVEMKTKELFTVYDENCNPVGTATRKEAHKEGLWHEVVHCWLVCRHSGRTWIYLQQRAFDKAEFPGYYDIGSTGHVDAGESHLDAVCREAMEETGLRLDKKRLTYLGMTKEEEPLDDGYDREFARVYLYEMDMPFFAPGDEVERMAAVSLEEMMNLELLGAEAMQASFLEGEPFMIHKDQLCRHPGEFETLVYPAILK